MHEAGTATVIGRSMKIRGEFTGTDDLLIEGEVEGTVSIPGALLTVGSEGRVRANLAARDIVISGKVAGEIRATGSVSLLATAVVLGDIFSTRFSMEENSTLRGQVDPGGPAAAADTSVSQPVAAAEPAPQPHPAALQLEHLPAGLAAAARQFEEGTSPESENSASRDDRNSGDSPELAETEA